MLSERRASAYRAYLLRLWRAGGGWRASLMDPHTSEQLAFAGLEALFAFLSRTTQDPPELSDGPGGEPAPLEQNIPPDPQASGA
jgi:hypothetical protein